MTEKPSITFDGADDLHLPEVQHAIATSTMDGVLKQIEHACFEVMAEAGLPLEYGSFLYRQDGDWAPISADALKEGGWTIANEHWPIARSRGFSEHSVYGFAARMLGNTRAARLARREGDHDRAGLMMFHLGVQQTELRLKREREKEWKTGKKQTDTLTEQRDRANSLRQRQREAEWGKWNEEASSIRMANPHIKSRSAVAEIVIKRLGLSDSVNTVRMRLTKS